MTEEQPPDFVVRSYSSSVHAGLPSTSQLPGLSQEQMSTFQAWNQNQATKTDLTAGAVAVAGTATSGTVNGKTMGVGPPTAVSVKDINMLVSQDFTSPDTVVTSNSVLPTSSDVPVSRGQWSWDGEDGNITLGCARVDCDGTQDDLVSNEIPVITGENIEVSVQVKWQNIVYTGTKPIILGVEKYRQGKDQTTGGVTYLDVGGVDIAWITSPGANGNWGDGDIAGTYVVEAGVDLLRFRFRAAHAITSGTVKWDEAVFLKLDLIADNAVPGVGTTVDDIVTNLYGSQGEGFTHNAAALALANTSASILSINARLSESEAAASPGQIAGDDFLWTGEVTASANWGGGYLIQIPNNGEYDANGADAVWSGIVATFTPNQRCWFDWQGTGAVSSTDYQLVRLLLSSAPITHVAGFKSWVHLIGRISTGFGQYVRAAFCSDGTYFVDYWNGSNFVVMNSGSCAVPGTGALLSLYCGKKSTSAPRHFTLLSNQTAVADFDDTTGLSPLGASNRKWGWGAQAEGGYFINSGFAGDVGQGTPPKVNQWLGYDQ